MTADILQGLWASRINVPPDLIQSLRGTETHTRNDYLGRVVFEFFQNAVDRAENRIERREAGIDCWAGRACIYRLPNGCRRDGASGLLLRR